MVLEMKQEKSLYTVRVLSVLLVLVFAISLYLEWHYPLSPESQKYQADYPDAIRSGPDLMYVLSKLAWLAGCVSGVMGVLMILFTKRHGLVPIILSAPLIAWGAYLQAPQSNYPSVEPMFQILLWCVTAALWGMVTALSLQRDS